MDTNLFVRPDIRCATSEMPKTKYQLHANRIKNGFLTVISKCVKVRLGYQEQRYCYLWFNNVSGRCGISETRGVRSSEWELLGVYPVGVLCYDDISFSYFVKNSNRDDAVAVYYKLKEIYGKFDIEKPFGTAVENEKFFNQIAFSQGDDVERHFDKKMYDIQEKFEKNVFNDYVFFEWKKIKERYDI